MKPILFSIGDVNIYGYGLMFALGILGGVMLSSWLAKKRGADADFLFNMAIWVVVFGFIGSKITYLITIFPEFIAAPLETLKNSLSQGFVVYGASIAGFLTVLIYCRIKKKNMWEYADIASPGLAFGSAIGRIGCFLAGCCYGVECDGWCAVTFPRESSAPAGVPLVPIQLISFAANLILMGILLVFIKKNKIKGRVMALWMMLYSVGRGVLEIFRDDPRGSVGVFSTSQFISLITFVLGAVLFIVLTKKAVHKDDAPAEDAEEAKPGENEESDICAEETETAEGTEPEEAEAPVIETADIPTPVHTADADAGNDEDGSIFEDIDLDDAGSTEKND